MIRATMAKLLSGKEVSEEIRARLQREIAQLPITPVLAMFQVGERSDSRVYIRTKTNFARSVGVETRHFHLPNTVSEKELADEIDKQNQDPSVHGILLQLPLDSVNAIDTHYIINRISPWKDVDGLTTISAGNLLHADIGVEHGFVPCTPAGCLELIKKTQVRIEGSRAVVLGRSKLNGAPMAQLLTWNNATVTVCHSKTQNLAEITKMADILVVAIGKPKFVQKDWVKPGAVVIDVGITSVPDPSKTSGQRLVGDVDFEAVKEVASFITPVPGGVGPMTVAMLISNTVNSARRICGKLNGCSK